MKTLKDVAKTYKTKALQAINPGVPYSSYKTGVSKAYKTGNLYNRVAGANNPDTMFRYDKQTDKYTFTFVVSPNGAEYGKYVNDGTYKMGKRPFAQIAAESPEFALAVKQFVNENIIEDKMELIFDQFNKKAKKAGLIVD